MESIWWGFLFIDILGLAGCNIVLMKPFLPLLIFISLFSFSCSFVKGQVIKEPKNYWSIGFLDYKTGTSFFSYTRTLMNYKKHELFVGIGTLIAMNTLSAGWKYYLLNSPVHLYSVISIQGVAGI